MKKILLITILFTTSIAFAGNDGGHGGDVYGAEFELLARNLEKTFEKNPDNHSLEKWNIKPTIFLNAIDNTLIRSREGYAVKLNNEEVDCINNNSAGSWEITINRTRWREKRLLEKLQLVVHEYLSLLNIEINHYPATSDLSDLIIQTYQTIKDNPLLNGVNLYYGYQQIFPQLSSATICDPSSQVYKDALELADKIALAKCSFYENDCKITNHQIEQIISQEIAGYKFCSITSIAK